MSRNRPARHWRDRALDAIEASEETRGFVGSMTYEAFIGDARTVKAVLANFSIIGEAIAHIPRELLAEQPHIPWGEIRATRNIIAHVYFGVELRIIWNTINQDLEPLERALRAVLATHDA